MGHWATYRRRGGGPSTAAALNFMTNVGGLGAFDLEADYNATVDEADLDENDFETVPTAFVAANLTQGDFNTIEVNFLDDISSETALTYSGSAPGFVHPQTIAIT